MQRRAFLIAIACLMACGGDAIDGAAPYETALTAPWDGDGLPLESGHVVFSDEQMLTVRFEGGDRALIAQRFDAALVAAGHPRRVDTSAADMSSITYGKKGGAIVALGVLALNDTVTVSLTRYSR